MGTGCEATGKSPTFRERLRSVLFGKIPEWTLSPEGKDMGFRKRASAIRSELIERIEATGIVKSDKIIAELGIQGGSSTLAIGLIDTASKKRFIRPFVDETKPVFVEDIGSKLDKNGGNSYRVCVFPAEYDNEPYIILIFPDGESFSFPFHEWDGGVEGMLQRIEEGSIRHDLLYQSTALRRQRFRKSCLTAE